MRSAIASTFARAATVVTALLVAGCSGATCSGPPATDGGPGSDAAPGDAGGTDATPGTDAAGDAAPGTDAAPRPVDVVINEVMASNVASFSDEAGEFDDWLELYNTTAAPVDLTGFTMTDDLGLEIPWPFPAGTIIDAGGWLVVWCDEGAGQGPLHADFRLSASGETIVLLDPAGVTADALTFPPAIADVSWARVPDGAATQQELTPATPGAAN